MFFGVFFLEGDVRQKQSFGSYSYIYILFYYYYYSLFCLVLLRVCRTLVFNHPPNITWNGMGKQIGGSCVHAYCVKEPLYLNAHHDS